MCAFLDFLQNKTPGSEFTEELQKAVEKAIDNPEWRQDYMTLLMRDQENREIGKAENKVRNIKAATLSLGSLDKALELLQISREEYEEALELIKDANES